MIDLIQGRRILTNLIQDYTGGERPWAQYKRAIGAMVGAAFEKGLLHPHVIADQLLYVAAKIMLEHEHQHNDGELEKFCADYAKRLEKWADRELEFIDRLLAEPKSK